MKTQQANAFQRKQYFHFNTQLKDKLDKALLEIERKQKEKDDKRTEQLIQQIHYAFTHK